MSLKIRTSLIFYKKLRTTERKKERKEKNTVRLGSRCRSVFKTREFRFNYLTNMKGMLAFCCKSNIGRDMEC
jgi:hypothetical protein